MKKNFVFKSISILLGIFAGVAAAEFLACIIMPKPLYFPKIKVKALPIKLYQGNILWNIDGVDMEKSVKTAATQKDSFRIVGLGDSIMYGAGISRKDTYIERLGNALAKESGRKTVVANLSQPGYNLRQESALFELVGVNAKPNLVIIHAWEDDLVEYLVVGGVIYGSDVYSKSGIVRTIPLPAAVNDFLILRSRLYQYLSLLAITHKGKQTNDINRNRAVCRQALESLYDNSNISGAKIVILLSPSLNKGKIQSFKNTPDKHAFYFMIIDWAKSRKVDVIDLTEKMAGVDGESIGLDGIHFNKKGHDLILKILTDYIPARYMKQAPAVPPH